MKINFQEIAQIELEDAIEYYNYEASGLGDAFLTEVLNALDRIESKNAEHQLGEGCSFRCAPFTPLKLGVRFKKHLDVVPSKRYNVLKYTYRR